MNNSPLVTIAIPFYNSEYYLSHAIKSVLAQSYQNFELILVDDGSKDNSLDIAKDFARQDSRIRVISDGINKKLPARLNQIITEAQGEYIARMDADDVISPKRLEIQLAVLEEKSNIDLVSTGILSLKNDLSLVGYRGTPSDKEITLNDAIMGTTGIIHASVMARTKWWRRNLYNINNKLAEDYELWLKAFLANDLKVAFIEKPLYYYREDLNIQLNKLLTAYNSQINIIQSLPSDLLPNSTKKKFLNKFRIKKLLVRAIFLVGKDSLLHRRRADESKNAVYQSQLTDELNIIMNAKMK